MVSISDSGNSTMTDSNNFNLSVDAAVSYVDLDGSVSGNTVTVSDMSTYTSSNAISEGSLTDVAGITLVAQNGGVNSLIQQNVSVQSSLSIGQSGGAN
jgi:hypothetical protein